MEVFNREFDQNRTSDEFADNGYGDWFKKNKPTNKPTKKLNKQNFNDEFQKHKSKKVGSQLQKYTEPKELVSMSNADSILVLGKEKVTSYTGESNGLRYKPKGTVICLGPEPDDLLKQTVLSLFLGNSVISQISTEEHDFLISLGFEKDNIHRINGSPGLSLFASKSYNAVFYFGNSISLQEVILSSRSELIPIITSIHEAWELVKEQVITEDTTASGGNANLLAL